MNIYLLNSHLRFNFYSCNYFIKENRSFGLKSYWILHFFYGFDFIFIRNNIFLSIHFSVVLWYQQSVSASFINDFYWKIRSCFDELIFLPFFLSSIFIFCEEDFKHLQRPIAGKRKQNVHKHMSPLGLWYCNSAEFAMLSSTPSLWIINHYGTLM